MEVKVDRDIACSDADPKGRVYARRGRMGHFGKPYHATLPSQTPPATCAVVEALRRQRHTGQQIATEVGVSPATVSRIPRRLGLNRIRDLSGSLRIPPHAALHRNQPDRVQRQSRDLGKTVKRGDRKSVV